MIKVKFGYKVWAFITFIVVSLAVLLSGLDISKIEVNATETGNSFFKHVYATNETTPYFLPEIPTTNPYSLQRSAISDYVESRPLASNYEGVVEVNGVALGTGFIIGENKIMTAVHCVYSKPDGANIGAFSDNCTIKIPDANPYSTPISVTAISVHIPAIGKDIIDNPQNYTNGLQDYDYAILTIDVDDLDLSETEKADGLLNYGSFLLGMTLEDFSDRELPVHCMGFKDTSIRISNVNYDYTTPINMGDLSYDFALTAYSRTSGGPIYTECQFGVSGANGEFGLNTYRTVISIVSGIQPGSNNQIITSGTRVRPEIMQFAYGNSNL